MSIRLIAQDLYRLRKQVEKLEEQLKNTPAEKQGEVENLIRQTKAELNKVQRMLDGAKEPSPYRRPL